MQIARRVVDSDARQGIDCRMLLVDGLAGSGKTRFVDWVTSYAAAHGHLSLSGRHDRASHMAPFSALQEALNYSLRKSEMPSSGMQKSFESLRHYISQHTPHIGYFIDLPEADRMDYSEYAAAVDECHRQFDRDGELNLATTLSNYHLQLKLLATEVRSYGETQDLRSEALRIIDAVDRVVSSVLGVSFWEAYRVPKPIVTSAQSRSSVPELIDPESRRRQFFDIVSKMFRHAGRPNKVILAIDDLHWADSGMLDLLQYLLDSRMDELLVIGAYRQEEATGAGSVESEPFRRFLAEVGINASTRILRMPALQEASIRKILAIALPGYTSDEDFLMEVVSRAEGNPLFVREILRYMVDRSDLVWTEAEGWRLAGRLQSEYLPVSIERLLGRRLERLTSPANRFLGAAAVVGRSFPFPLAALTADIGTDESLLSLQEVCARGLVEESTSPEAGWNSEPWRNEVYDFSHGLLQEIMYSSVVKAIRMRLHGRVAKELERHTSDKFGSASAKIAYHYSLSLEPTRAVPFLLADGLRNLGLHSRGVALRQFNAAKVIAAIDEEFSGTLLVSYLDLLIADLTRLDGELSSAGDLYEEILRRTPRAAVFGSDPTVSLLRRVHRSVAVIFLGDEEPARKQEPAEHRLTAEALLGLGRIEMKRSRFTLSERYMSEAVAVAERHGDVLLEVRGRRSLGWLHLAHGKLTDAHRQFDACLDRMAEHELDLPEARSRLLGDVARTYFLQGDIARSCDLTKEAIDFAFSVGDRPAEAILLSNFGRSLHLMGKWSEAYDAFVRSRRLAMELNDQFNAGFPLSNIAKLECDLGLYREALDHAQEFIVLCQGNGYRYGESIGYLTQVNALFMLGEDGKARSALAVALRIQRSLDVSYAMPFGLQMLGRYRLHSGEYRLALVAFERSLRGFDAGKDDYQVALSRYYMAECHYERGQSVLSRAQLLELVSYLRGRMFLLLEVRVRALLALIAAECGRPLLSRLHGSACLRISAALDADLHRQLLEKLRNVL